MNVAAPEDIPLEAPAADRRAEARALLRVLGRVPGLAARRALVPPGDGRPVMIVPGFLTGDGSTAVLRAWLWSLNHEVSPARMGFNDGRLERLVPRAERRLMRLAERHGTPVKLVGWSLGGVIARELARRRPDAVDRIITLGTPVRGGPRYTSARRIFEMRGVDLDAVERRVDERNAQVIAAPITAIYSRRDAVVHWGACFDPNPENDVAYVEVDAHHTELGFCPDVLEIVARRLV